MVAMNLKNDWIPPSERTPTQKKLHNLFIDRAGRFGVVGSRVDLPERALLYNLEIATTGKLCPRVWQSSGSCVASAAARAYLHAQCGDVYHRGDNEHIALPFPFATYGVGRELMGARSTGEGSFGASQAKAVETFGLLPLDHPSVPQPEIRGIWYKWTAKQEIQWSHPRAWPVARNILEQDAVKNKMGTVTQCASIEDICQSLAQGYGVTMACMFGTRGCVVKEDVLMAPWNDSWAHQQCVAGYWRHPKLGLIFCIDNQWGDMHGKCPTLSELGVTGSYWITEADMAKILRQDGEVFAHSATPGFEIRPPDWALAL